MKNTHWIDLAYQNLKIKLPIPEFKFQVRDKWGKHIKLDERFYDDVPLISREDFLGREIRHIGELISKNRFERFRKRFHKDGITSAQHYIVEFNRKNRHLNIDLIRGIAPMSLENQYEARSYRAFNTFFISSFDEEGENSFYGTFGRDFTCSEIYDCYRFDKIKNIIIALIMSQEREYIKSSGIDPEEVEKQQCLMPPEQYIKEFAVPFVMRVYNELIK